MAHQGKIKLLHKKMDGQQFIRIDFPMHIEVFKSAVKHLKDRKWDKKGQFLYLPNTKEHLKDIFQKFKGIAWVDTTAFFAKKQKHQPKRAKKPSEFDDCSIDLEERLLLRAYSPQTIKSYKSAFRAFLSFYPQKHPKDITKDEIEDYLLYCIRSLQYSESTQNLIINAIKFYYESVLKLPKESQKATRSTKRRRCFKDIENTQKLEAQGYFIAYLFGRA
jgi:hypothetical protein